MNSVKINSRRRKKRSSYHHGDLRQQLLSVTEQIILERGVDGFTLREAARRAGVSPAAPAHHFKDAKGLLTEVAVLGFQEFGDALAAADEEVGLDPAQRLRGQGRAYVHFAMKQPARFQLMFRHDKLDVANPEFERVARRAYSVLEGAIHAATDTSTGGDLAPASYGLLLAVWSIVHGFSHLALQGQFRRGGPGNPPASREEVLESFLPLLLNYLPVKKL